VSVPTARSSEQAPEQSVAGLQTDVEASQYVQCFCTTSNNTTAQSCMRQYSSPPYLRAGWCCTAVWLHTLRMIIMLPTPSSSVQRPDNDAEQDSPGSTANFPVFDRPPYKVATAMQQHNSVEMQQPRGSSFSFAQHLTCLAYSSEVHAAARVACFGTSAVLEQQHGSSLPCRCTNCQLNSLEQHQPNQLPSTACSYVGQCCGAA